MRVAFTVNGKPVVRRGRAAHRDSPDRRKRRRESGRSIDFSTLAEDGLRADYTFANNHKHTYAYGTAAAHVAVDPGTGHVELVDCLVVENVGRIANPLSLHGQVIGAVVQGLGGAVMEDLVYDEKGHLLAGTLADYLIPSATDFPQVPAISLQHRPSTDLPARRQGRGRRRHHPDWRPDGRCGRGGSVLAWRRAERVAAVAGARLADGEPGPPLSGPL